MEICRIGLNVVPYIQDDTRNMGETLHMSQHEKTLLRLCPLANHTEFDFTIRYSLCSCLIPDFYNTTGRADTHTHMHSVLFIDVNQNHLLSGKMYPVSTGYKMAGC